ncbi:MAG: hypothetical protein LBD43_03105, partial [Holosporales bacterium]|nr:hypothetical protein [Holosporales bacterium]
MCLLQSALYPHLSHQFLLPICVFVFAILFFNIGIENLFKTPVRNVIINARDVASIYIDDVKFNMENFTNDLSEEIPSCING